MQTAIDLNAALRHHFAFPNFRSGQREALEYVLAGRDTLVVMPTGHGKSLIYQLAALLLPGTALVVSPLISLMKDQADSLARHNIAATFINSSLSTSQQNHRLAEMAAGCYKIVFVAPERLRSRSFSTALSRICLNLLVVDEAHCLSHWGHDFRPDYLHIAAVRRNLGKPITLALTATATRKVQDDIVDLLGLSCAERLITGFNRPNLSLEVVSAADVRDKLAVLHDFLSEDQGAGIIYTGTRRDSEEVAEFIAEALNLEARHYHAGLEPEARSAVQDAFMAGDLPLVVATNAFGMGIDRPDVRFVLHYAMPGSLEAYYQEAGRAGRDGLPARSVLIYSPKDTALHEFFIENDAPRIEELSAVHTYLVNLDRDLSGGASRMMAFHINDLTASTGIPEVKARVALKELEAAHALTRAPNEAGNLIRIQPHSLSESALRKISAQIEARRKHKRAMLEKIVDYAETNGCRRRVILHHFGDTGPVGAPICCDNCLARAGAGEDGFRPAKSQSERAALIVLDTLARLRWGLGKTKIARILKGSAAKAVARYTNHCHYGKFAGLRMVEIEALIDQLLKTGYIKTVGSDRPVLTLTPKGQLALQRKAAVQVELRPVRRGAAQRLKAERQAGGTLALTQQMLAAGLTPEQIAAERGLATGTILSHLARLITAGEVHVDAVVPLEQQKLIRAAIEAVGSPEPLAYLKFRLPEEIDYGTIRCVVEAWKLERSTASSSPLGSRPTGRDRAARVCTLGSLGNSEHIHELIGALEDSNANVRRLAASGLGKLTAVEAVEPLLKLLDKETHPQVRQYAVKALGKIGDPRAHARLKSISTDSDEKSYTRKSAGQALRALRRSAPPSSDLATLGPLDDQTTKQIDYSESSDLSDPITAFLSRPHPRPLKGPWLAGWALDFHSRFEGDEPVRGIIGDLVYRYKYCGEHHLAGSLVDRWVELLGEHPELPAPQAIVPIPPSTPRDFDPVSHLAQELARCLGISVLLDALVKTRQTRPQKELKSLAAKQSNVAGAFSLQGSVRDLHILLVDDLFDSGATLFEAARILERGRPASTIVLTLTKTIHSDQ
ncbi:MAG: RecQ family ATP-dependent DNA helicase [Anaerolineales bacterium]|jgi:ATP-dependent DNA helicase RecQ